MEYAARLPKAPSRRTIVAPLVALLVGAGAATGAYALIDDGNSTTQPANVIVVEKPGPHAADIPGKNEAGTAAAISQSSGTRATDIPGKNESATAAAISKSGGIELRGSKASATSKPTFDAQSAAEAPRISPQFPESARH